MYIILGIILYLLTGTVFTCILRKFKLPMISFEVFEEPRWHVTLVESSGDAGLCTLLWPVFLMTYFPLLFIGVVVVFLFRVVGKVTLMLCHADVR